MYCAILYCIELSITIEVSMLPGQKLFLPIVQSEDIKSNMRKICYF